MNSGEVDIFIKVVMAVCFGGIIGLERELVKKPAGIRTHMFVAGAATLVISLSGALIEQFSRNNIAVQADPVRVIEAVIVGISFIGAGTVLKSESSHNVYYLTTAASILFAAGIGIAVATEMYYLSALLTGLVVMINALFGSLEQKYWRKYELKTPPEPDDPNKKV